MTEENNKKIENLKHRLMHPKATTFDMKRVPVESVEVFKKWANDEFVGDYGMAFKKLVDVLLIEPQPYITMNEVIKDHEERLAKLEHTEPKKVKTRRMLSGREIKIPIKE